MQVYCCFVFLFIFHFKFLQLSCPPDIWSFFLNFILKDIFSCLYCIHKREFSQQPFTFDWTSPTVPMATPAFCCTTELALYIYIFGRQSPIDDCSYEMTIQTIFSFHVIHVICTFFRHFLSSSVVCYFQHSTTFVIMLLIVLINIEMYFSNTDLFFCFLKGNMSLVQIIPPPPLVISLKMNLVSSLGCPCLTYFFKLVN